MNKEELTELVLQKHSKHHTSQLAAKIAGNPKDVSVLWQIIITGESPVPERASWILSHLFDMRPEVLDDMATPFIDQLPISDHQAIKRNILRCLAGMPIPESDAGALFNICVDWIYSAREDVAVRAHAMTIVTNIALEEPGLIDEVKVVIEDQYENGSTGIQSRCRNLLKRISRAGNK